MQLTRTFNVKAKDLASQKEVTLQVTGNLDEEAAKTHVKNQGRSVGGVHPGFEIVGVEEVKPAADATVPAEANA